MNEPEIKYCKRGHPRTPENTYKSGKCKVCSQEYSRKWKIANPEKVKMHDQKYREKNRDKDRARSRSWYALNKERHRETCKKWKVANPEKAKAATRNWKAVYQMRNREIDRINVRKRRAANPEKARQAVREWRAKNQGRLLDSIVLNGTGLRVCEAPPELIEIRRLTIKLHRSLKNGNQVRV